MPEEKFNLNDKSSMIRLIGVSLVLLGLSGLLVIYSPIGFRYLSYYFGKSDHQKIETEVEKVVKSEEVDTDIPQSILELFPDNEYSLYIPKIDAKAKVVANVDPFNEAEYTQALKSGVAQANTSALPDQKGNTFLFAHSALDFYDLLSENVNFYLLTKLDKDDTVFLMFKNEILEYKVVENNIVDPDQINYLSASKVRESVTLMTCWPAGTDYKRVIVVAERI